ncbi:MAG: hypoxanthine phosphoribosyltransferase [Clostridia bacterium]|nr:hypoxanthine phosphoribosyltransferase [Clostridia bacterium]
MNNKDIQRVLVTKEEIAVRVKELGEQITKDFAGEEIIAVCILKGSCIFYSDLIREINLPAKFDFMVLSSYGSGTTSSREVKIIKDLTEDIKGKNVLVVEDIIDSGRTIKSLKELLIKREPKSLKVVTMLDKPERREVDIQTDYTGVVIPDEFVIGYGLDYAQKYRNLKDICVLSPEVYSK